MQRAFPLRADVVVIGGGVVGVSTAYHLAALGHADVVVVEREEALGMGSTGRSAGGVRIQFSTEVNVRLSAWSIEMLRRFGELTGESAGLRQHGYLIVTGDVAEMSRFEQNVALQRSLGFDVKLLDPRRAQALVPQLRVDDLPDLPMVIDFDSGFYVRREGERLLFGMANPEEGPGFRTDVDGAFLPRVLEAGVHRLPALAEARVRRGWAGLYEVSPDHNAIIGEAPEVQGFYLANGFSGHGFQQAPAVGRVLAEMILGLPLSVDVSPLDIRRFSTGGRLVESQVV
ncbi:MAG: FAD-binding oxidoreductase [Limnochordaceae bacterium]|nr:FAD-binding oxidoreductase [Limnochordaceae bacterium]